jgi:hypothetical protein
MTCTTILTLQATTTNTTSTTVAMIFQALATIDIIDCVTTKQRQAKMDRYGTYRGIKAASDAGPTGKFLSAG